MKRQSAKGMVLLEILVALGVFGLLLGVLTTLMKQESDLSRNAAAMLQAQLQANEIMETLKVYPFDELEQASTLLTLNADRRHKARLLISDFNESPDLKKIVITVNWFDHKGYTKQYMLTTLRSRYTLSVYNESL